MRNSLLVHFIALHFVILAWMQLAKAQVSDSIIAIDVGVILDMDTWSGKVSTTCMQMAISDFYEIHGGYKTRLVLHAKDSKMEVTGAAIAAMDLLQNSEVQVIIGPQKSAQTEFIVDLGEKSQIPIISFSATNPSIYSRSRFFVRTTPDDLSQVKAVASIAQAFEWRRVILIYEDTEYGNRLVPHLIDAFEEINTRILHRSVISSSATDDQIFEELNSLKTMQASVFIVHMSEDVGGEFFLKAKDAGMMTEGYVWIITNGLMNVLESLGHSVIESMQGVLGVSPYIPKSARLEDFTNRWKRKFMEDHLDIKDAEMTSFGPWAYDTIWALAMAAERVGYTKSKIATDSHLKSNHLLNMDVSYTGPKLLEEILKIEFDGLSGQFHLVNGQLQPSAFQILNVVGDRGREIGVWTSSHGISKDLNLGTDETHLQKSDILGDILWPGETKIVPKGWVIPVKGKKLKIGVPVHDGFSELVKVKMDPITNATVVSGYCIDVFISAINTLPYDIPYEFIPFHKDDGNNSGSYTDLIEQVYLQKFDAVVGDITITAKRSLYVDFAFPYIDGGVWMIVPFKQTAKHLKWTTLDITGFLSMGLLTFTGFVVWVLERNEELARTSYPPSNVIFSIILSTAAFTHRKKITGFLSKLMVGTWLIIIFQLASSSLNSFLSVSTLEVPEPTITDFHDLIKNGDYVGYKRGSFVFELLKRSGFNESKLVPYSSPQECHELLASNGGVLAVFDESPYVSIFLEEYCSKYTVVGPTHRTDGFGFVFPKGSPLGSDISKAVLEVTEGNKLLGMEHAWFKPETTCEERQGHISTFKNPSIFQISACILVFSFPIVSSILSGKPKQL
ncbi:hypothetical protein ACHQM5_006617 [Ranunculus cassubicifolius]